MHIEATQALADYPVGWLDHFKHFNVRRDAERLVNLRAEQLIMAR